MRLYEKFVEKYLDKVKIDENLMKYHTFRLEGIASVIAEPTTVDELVEMIEVCKVNEYRYTIIGRGSNILFNNGEYTGILIVTKNIKEITVEGNKIKCSCGAPLPLVARTALNNNLAGMEKLSGIPGSMGGAILMNAGAYGSEIKDILTSVTVLDSDGKIKTVIPEELELSYRHSNIKERKYIVLECELTLKKGKFDEIKAIMDECNAKRLSSQPIEYPNAGSIFKKEGEHFAGKLIDDCGLKGFSVGGAMVSTKHANFIVNKEKATSKDVLDLITYIQQAIYIQKNVELHTEVEII